MLGALVGLPSLHAQDGNQSTTYYQISFMKSRPGHDPVKMERDLWKPLQAGRLQSGQIKSWSVMRPIFSGPHEYDYITVEAYSSLDAMTKTDYMGLFEKYWGKDKIQSSMEQTEQARDMLGNEVWVTVESVGGGAPSK